MTGRSLRKPKFVYRTIRHCDFCGTEVGTALALECKECGGTFCERDLNAHECGENRP